MVKEPKISWYKRKDGTEVMKSGNWKLLEIFKRPHKGYCCMVFDKGKCVSSEGYFGTSLPKKHFSVRWGCKKARELNILK